MNPNNSNPTQNQNNPAATPEPTITGAVDPTATQTAPPVAQPQPMPTVLLQKPKSNKLVIIVLIAVLLLAAGVAAWWFFTQNQSTDQSNNSTDTNQSEQAEVPETIELASGTLTLQPASDTVTFYDMDTSAGGVPTLDTSRSISLDISEDWLIYEKALDSSAGMSGFGEILLKSPSGKYLSVARIEGVGGVCEDVDQTEYTLTKKLATKDPNIYFTQYSSEARESYFGLEKLDPDSTGYGPTTWAKHLTLKEGESNTDICNYGWYPFAVGAIYVTIRSTPEGGEDSRLTWDQIKDDAEFVSALQSLSVSVKQ